MAGVKIDGGLVEVGDALRDHADGFEGVVREVHSTQIVLEMIAGGERTRPPAELFRNSWDPKRTDDETVVPRGVAEATPLHELTASHRRTAAAEPEIDPGRVGGQLEPDDREWSEEEVAEATEALHAAARDADEEAATLRVQSRRVQR